jgi:hypothetical protein
MLKREEMRRKIMTVTNGEIATYIGVSIVILVGLLLLISRILAFIEKNKKNVEKKKSISKKSN